MKARKMVGWIMSTLWVLFVSFGSYKLMFGGMGLSLEGKIDDCCTDFRDIDTINDKIHPVLLKLVETSFFRRFKVDLQAKCPFWALNEICKNPKSCGVCYCDEKDIPLNWKQEDQKIFERGRISPAVTEFYQEKADEVGTDHWGLSEPDTNRSVYVDLVKNVESYTGYQGQSVWAAIYRDNCFKGSDCLEERLLTRAISGMHASVSTHLCEHYNDFILNETYPHMSMYFERVGGYPDRLKNLYFAFTILLRGLNIASEHLKTYNFSTGNFMEDVSTSKLVQELLVLSQNHADVPFDESLLFRDQSKLEVKKQLQGYFKNITRIMNCVDCEKCRTYGKLQIAGLGTSLKLIFDESSKKKVSLSRNEIIALVNTMTKWSTSIKLIEKMYQRINDRNFESIRLCTLFFVLILALAKIMLIAHLRTVQAFKKRVSGVQ